MCNPFTSQCRSLIQSSAKVYNFAVAHLPDLRWQLWNAGGKSDIYHPGFTTRGGDALMFLSDAGRLGDAVVHNLRIRQPKFFRAALMTTAAFPTSFYQGFTAICIREGESFAVGKPDVRIQMG
ncbi:uncharacterized protein PGTG_04782 [Puccinia graminis f. sp. tritici CRL 75-36-700-3]|uniref:Uncharacterized protein n=1 Tax=Puccinia graminis f. sp. tritici (strain CRL 75-36-700-3 / race SCCL) TaxID=418459 RepID=E3K424_PUCGT|nr:uncharacterized protein PGTG_04782 [Puccinia graminis f. sp. tritici CRL 75-36-700-3]EFP78826.1 hypothetical protein PGTG_04782 [Puccinia graminis f. sp. tritici CRL 75-36-700-3]